MKVKRKFNIILALIISLVLWGYVFGQSNSTIKTTIKDVPIVVENAHILSEDGLAVGYMETNTVNITFSGRRFVTSKLTQDDFVVSLDVSGLHEGSTTVRLNVTAPEDVMISSVSNQSIKVEVEEKVTLEKDIFIEVVNDNSDETEPYVVQLSSERVDVTGAKSLINDVSNVVAKLDTKKVTDEMQSFNAVLTPVDKEGNEIRGLSLSVENVSITAKLAHKKTVPLYTEILGEDKTRLGRSAECPTAITLKGDDEVLNRINEITAEPLDISDVYENCIVPFNLDLPRGVTLAADSVKIGAKVTVEKGSVKEFEFHETDVVANGVMPETTVTVNKATIIVKVAGQSSVIDNIRKEDISLSVDASDLYLGDFRRELILTCTKEVDLLVSNIEMIEIYVE